MIRTTLTVLLAILWLPISSHCLLLESAANFEFLACCTHEKPAPPHADECATDSCSVVEAANYKSAIQRVTVPQADKHLLFELPPLVETAPPFRAIGTQPTDDALAHLPVAWQFSARTALPPRAPSFVS